MRPEEIRRIVVKAVSAAGAGSRPICLGFVGVQGSEGCTRITAEFAAELALRKQDKVAVVDACQDGPSVHEYFKIKVAPGVSELLRGECSVGDARQIAASGSVSVFAHGRPDEQSTALMTGRSMPDLLDQLRSEFDYIAVDIGRFGSGPAPIAVASAVDGIIVVVRSEATRAIAARRVIDELSTVQPNILGVVLNRRRNWLPEWLYKRL